MLNQRGVIHTPPLLIILAAVAIISYLLISSVAPFKSGVFSNLFPKNFSQAATAGVAFVDANGNVITQTSSPTVNVRLTAPWSPHVAMFLHQQQLASRHGHSAEAIAGVTTLVIYNDALRRGWTNGPYSSTINFSNNSNSRSSSVNNMRMDRGGQDASGGTSLSECAASAVIAEDASFTKNVKTISPYPSNPFTIPYTFSTSTPGTKTVFVTFTSSTGQTQTFSASIQLVDLSTPTPSPIVTPTPNPTTTPVPGGSMSGLHISGDKFLNGANQQVQLHGVNFSSFEYGCVNGYFNDGPQPPIQAEVNGMKSWHINTVRVVLNEDCWLGINGVNPSVAGQNYINAVSTFVNLLSSNNIAVIVNLHFNTPGTHLAREQEPMADRDHSPAFWSSVANTYKGNSAVVFEPYNEPHDISWQCWRDGGCTVTGTQSGEGQFTAAGMQEMVTAIRNAGATNPIIVTGLNWGSDISSWVQFKPNDPQSQLAAGWHSYGDGLSCQDLNCWNTTLTSVLNTAPIVATEIGEFDCNHTYIDQVMNWLDTHDAQGYTAWTWGNFNCSVDPALLSGSDSSFSGTPSQTYGQGFHDHLLSRP